MAATLEANQGYLSGQVRNHNRDEELVIIFKSRKCFSLVLTST